MDAQFNFAYFDISFVPIAPVLLKLCHLNKFTYKIKVALFAKYTQRVISHTRNSIRIDMCSLQQYSICTRHTEIHFTYHLYWTFILHGNVFKWSVKQLQQLFKPFNTIDARQYNNALNLIMSHWNHPFSFRHSFTATFFCL